MSYTFINPDLKKNYSFKKGSYWIYKDSLTGNEDKFTVTNYEIDTLKGKDEDVDRYESLTMEISQTSLNNAETSYWNYRFTGNGMDMYYEHKNSGIEFYTGFSLYPLNQNIPALTLNGKTYERIAEIEIWKDAPYKNHSFFYLKDSIGFVKINLNVDTIHHVYELEGYNIIY